MVKSYIMIVVLPAGQENKLNNKGIRDMVNRVLYVFLPGLLQNENALLL